ncbi:cancer/testis antigen family 47 member A11 [Echinops telfairi]|uniref:Cancer/testis antigen family 47 member A11 n=1 Tax=Echinops telfairi TaxID=9371 RepID=A0AC55DRW9_ECHTE|nr:cancer/testis antigen family 47 member A11 [Echinops telfairi]
MSDSDEPDEGLEGLESPVGAGSEESVGGPGPVAEDPEEALAEAAATGQEQSNQELNRREESAIGPVAGEAVRLGEQALVVYEPQFPIVDFRFMFEGLIRSLLHRIYYNDHILIRSRGRVFLYPRQGTPSDSHSMSVLSARPSQGLDLSLVNRSPQLPDRDFSCTLGLRIDLPLAAQRLLLPGSLTSGLGLGLTLPLAGRSPLLPELLELPLNMPAVRAIEAARPALMGIESMPADLSKALASSKPTDQAAASQDKRAEVSSAISERNSRGSGAQQENLEEEETPEMTQYQPDNSDEETQKAEDEEEKKAGDKERENKEQEPETDLDPEEGSPRNVRGEK